MSQYHEKGEGEVDEGSVPFAPLKPRRNTRSWKSEAGKWQAEAEFYRRQAESAAANWQRRLFWNRFGWWTTGTLFSALLWWWFGC